MKISFEDIRNRKSVRTYEDRAIEHGVRQSLVSFLEANKNGPFGTVVRFELIDLTGAGQEELRELASYGNIKGPKYFMTGAIRSTFTSLLDYGYLMEKNILAAMTLGLGTCWVGGTFSRAGFMGKLNAGRGEVVAAVVPVGYAAKNKDVSDTATRVFVGADSRKPWKDIFFDCGTETPLTETSAGEFRTPLEALRLAPSASNKQPWRVIKDGTKIHLFLERTPGYSSAGKEDMQMIDMGIAMCNFDVAAHAAGLNGAWKTASGLKGKEGWEYIAVRE
jgi:nitroreductase